MFDGGHLIQAMALDIERFFNGSHKFKYRISGYKTFATAYEGVPVAVYSTDIGYKEVLSLEDACLILLIGCHEAAHVLNRHDLVRHSPDNNNAKDDLALEVFADFFGAKLFQTLILVGSETRRLFKQVGYSSLEKLYDELGNSLGVLYSTYYQWSESGKSYESALSRVGIAVAGTNSVLDRFLGVDVNRSYKVFEKLHKRTCLVGQSKPYLANNKLPHHAAILMAKVQKNGSMFHNMKPSVVYLLGGDTYDVPDEVKKIYVARKREELKALGLDLPLEKDVTD
ncbi:hypothetical protein K5E37_29000 [Pseudomonas sp. RIT778]|uniref:hypothetical protein n=1 Tax=Pseudomonas sp. RIT778 TaxID=2870471 RepID=UPI001C86B367|nr:hypothetical protein [Pseudomonas sp. RIT778]MBX8473092.1 hypothetical protein [Pseudomonas sp. RIT778]